MNQSLTEKAYETLSKQLFSGQRLPGQRLSDRDLSREMGMSRTPVRRAIQQLQNEGFIEELPQGGYRVSRPTHEQLRHIFEVREAIEISTVSHAAKRITQEQLQELGDICSELRKFAYAIRAMRLQVLDGEVARQINLLDIRFHLLILQAANNPKLLAMAKEHCIFSRAFGFHHFSARPQALRIISRNIYLWHKRIYRALKQGDGISAAENMRKHLYLAICEHEAIEQTASTLTWPQSFIDNITKLEQDL